jgi:hypothetical protein
MPIWEKIVENALLGTAKQSVDLSDAPAVIQQLEGSLSNEQELKLLQVATLALNFTKASKPIPPLPPEVKVAICKAEQATHCTERAAAVLEELLVEKRNSLIFFWLYRCLEKKQLVLPATLPLLLHFGRGHLEQKELVINTIGNRGLWLAHQNPAWHYLLPVGVEEDWEHGNMEERKRALQSMRKTNPALALEWLAAVWAEESATQRLEYLLILEEGLSVADEDFLKNKLSDRSGKVKTEALRLLRCIPNSAASQQVWDSVCQHFTIKQRKKQKEDSPLEILFQGQEQAKEDEGENFSYEEGSKKEQEKFFQETMESLRIIPPARWITHFNLSADEIITAFANTPKIRKLLLSIVEATLYYKDTLWAKALLAHQAGQDARLLGLLPYQEREKYAIHLLKSETDEVVAQMINDHYQEWSLVFSQKLMEVAITDVYGFNKEFFKRIIPFLHFDINKELLNYPFADDYRKSYWKGTATEISYLLGLREEIKQVFAH